MSVPGARWRISSSGIVDSSAAGRAILTAADVDAQNALLGQMVTIEKVNLVGATSYTSPAFAAGAYSRLLLTLYIDTPFGSGTDPSVTLTGPSFAGNYLAEYLYAVAGAAALATPASIWQCQGGSDKAGRWDWIVDIATGRPRACSGTQRTYFNRGAFKVEGHNDDTTHDVTGLAIVLPGATTGRVELRGLP